MDYRYEMINGMIANKLIKTMLQLIKYMSKLKKKAVNFLMKIKLKFIHQKTGTENILILKSKRMIKIKKFKL